MNLTVYCNRKIGTQKGSKTKNDNKVTKVLPSRKTLNMKNYFLGNNFKIKIILIGGIFKTKN